MPANLIVLASPNRTVVYKGEYALIELTLASYRDELTLVELPERTSLEVEGHEGSEVRWAGPTTLIYRAPTKGSSDQFTVRRGDGVYSHYIRVEHAAPISTRTEQVRLKSVFDAASPTIVLDGRGVDAPSRDAGRYITRIVATYNDGSTKDLT